MPSSPTCWRSSRWLAPAFASGLAALPVADFHLEWLALRGAHF